MTAQLGDIIKPVYFEINRDIKPCGNYKEHRGCHVANI
jgi:hypothetical protein